jgi:hypothetical protein
MFPSIEFPRMNQKHPDRYGIIPRSHERNFPAGEKFEDSKGVIRSHRSEDR